MLTTIGFYSFATPYEHEAKLLAASLDRVGMRHIITGFPDRETWYANTAAKAELIREARHSMSGPLLYVDVDAFVHQNCTRYFEGLAIRNIDLGVHWFAGPPKGKKRSQVCQCIRGARECNQPHRLLSGTLFLGDTKGARTLVDRWVQKNADLRAQGIYDGGGQKNLWRVVVEMGSALYMEKIPGRYCRVGDKSWAYPPTEPVVIEHTIASRENRDVRGRVNAWRRQRIAQLKTAVLKRLT